MDEIERRLRALVESGALSFDGAKKPHTLGDGAYSVLVAESAKAARAGRASGTSCYRRAVDTYWRLYDEQPKGRKKT